jgi:hypothetical protein
MKRPKDWPKGGWYWWLHHDKLLEWTYDIDERWDYVVTEKPKSELAVRLKAMRPVKGKIPKYITEAWDAYDKAWDAYREAQDARAAAWDARAAAWDAYCKAWDAYDKAWDAYCKALERKEIQTLHAKECPDVKHKNGCLVFGEES